jgi:hypothetical protein
MNRQRYRTLDHFGFPDKAGSAAGSAAVRKKLSMSQNAPRHARECRFGGDQDAPLPWLWLQRMTNGRVTPAQDQAVLTYCGQGESHLDFSCIFTFGHSSKETLLANNERVDDPSHR